MKNQFYSKQMNAANQFDVCIIGAGVAGGALAAFLGKNNVRVALIEKNLSEQDRIVGELLQPGGVMKLREMQLENLLDGFDAQLMTGYALFLNGKNFRVNYPEVENGRGFRNGKFVQTIRGYVQSLPSVKVFEGSVTDFVEENNGVRGVRYTDAETKEEKQINAALTVVSDGMFSGFREKLSSNQKDKQLFSGNDFERLCAALCQSRSRNYCRAIALFGLSGFFF